MASPVAQLELNHLLQSLELISPPSRPDNSFELILQPGLGPFLLWDGFTSFLALPFLQIAYSFWLWCVQLAEVALAVGRAGACKGGGVSALWRTKDKSQNCLVPQICHLWDRN